MKFLTLLLVFAVGLVGGVVLSAKFPEIPTKVAEILFPGIEPSKPTLEQINEVLRGSLALVEAQHTYYVHVTHNAKFAENIRELGSPDDKGGTVMVRDVWNASEAVAKPTPLHGYLFKILQVSMGPDKKDGFAVAAYPADEQNDKQNDKQKWPIFLSLIPDAKGGNLGMYSRDTWEIEGTAAAGEIRALLQRSDVTADDLEKFSPGNLATSVLIENFKKEAE